MSDLFPDRDQLDYWQRYDRDLAAIDKEDDGYRRMPDSFEGNLDPKRLCPECGNPLPARECR